LKDIHTSPVVDVPPLPAKYFRQFPWRDMPVKNKAPIEELKLRRY